MQKKTQIGERRYRIVIQQPTETRSASGGVISSWATFAEAWAKVVYLNTRSTEEVMGDQVNLSTAIAFDIAYRTGVTEKMRVQFDGGNYDIMYIQKPNFKESLVLQAIRTE